MARSLEIIKRKSFWLAILCGMAFSLILYQGLSTKLWPPDSLRVKLALISSFALACAGSFWLIDRFLPPRASRLTRAQWQAVLAVSALAPVILMLATINFSQFGREGIYLLLPSQTLTIRVPAAGLQGDEEVALSGFQSATEGVLSFEAMTLQGWERKGNRLVLTDPESNQIIWQGKTGQAATLFFKPRSQPASVQISWDSATADHSLFSSTTDDILIPHNFEIPFYAGWPMLALALYTAIALIVLTIYVGLLSRPGLRGASDGGRYAWLRHALPMYAVWSVYLLIFWPGFMSNDSVDQWGQMVTGKLVNWHPVAHTLSIWLITRLWYSPAAVAVVQILVLGGILGWGIATLRRHGAPAWLAWLTSALLAISPANSALSITLWKDVLYSAAVVALTIVFFNLAATRGGWLRRPASWVWLGLSALFIALYRQNGLFVSSLSLLSAAIVYRPYWKEVLKAGCLVAIVSFFFTAPVLRAFGVPSTQLERSEVILANVLAGHRLAGTYFAPAEQALMKPMFPGGAVWPYKCIRNLDLFRGLDHTYLAGHSAEILDIALQATLRRPGITVQHFACQGDFVYRIPQTVRNEMKFIGIAPNESGLHTTTLLPALYYPLQDALWRLTAPEQRGMAWLIWRMPFWMYLCLFGCALFCIRHRTWLPLLIFIPGLLTVLPLIFLSLGQIFRYVYSMYLIGILFSGYFWLCAFSTDNAAPDNPGKDRGNIDGDEVARI